MTGNSVKIEKFVLDYFKHLNKDSDKNLSSQIYDTLIKHYCDSNSNILDKESFTLYFTDEQLNILTTKQKELGYNNNFSRFVRYSLLDCFMEDHNVIIKTSKAIDINKFEQLLEKSKNVLVNGKYASYDLDLIRNNEKYKDKISIYGFNVVLDNETYNFDFLECDMLAFVVENLGKEKIYSDLIGLSTQQYLNDSFLELEDGETLEPFTDYENIVPDTDTFYYLYIYYAFVIDSDENLDLETVFNETDDHITSLLEKYTFEKILKYNKEKHNIEDVNVIFDEECLERLKSNELINFDEVTESNENVESDESNENVESDENVEVSEEVDNNV